MRKTPLALAATLLLSVTSLAMLDGQQAATPARQKPAAAATVLAPAAVLPDDTLESLRPDGLRAHMAFLADDLLEGRGTGSRGFQLAAKYIATQFSLSGLKPGAAGSSYFQDVRFRRWKLVPEKSSMSISRDGTEERLALNQDVLLLGHAEQADCAAEGELVYVGYGVSAPDHGYDDYAGIDVKGKIVVMLPGGPNHLPPAPGAVLSSSEVKAKNAASRGATGRITAWVGPITAAWPFPAVVREIGSEPRLAWLDPSGTPGRSSEGCGAMISPESFARILKGTSFTVKDLVDQAGARKAKAFRLPARASMRQVSAYDEITSPNVVGVLPGSDPRLRDEHVVITAHADHLGIGTPVEGDAIYNGAADNASGTAVLLEIARALAALPQGRAPRRSVLFLAVTGEEHGLLGSDFFASHPTVPVASIAANVNIDGVALFYDFKDIVAVGGEHSSLAAVVEGVARRMGLEVSPDPMPEEAFFVRSDHYSFVRQGIPSLMLGEGLKAVDPAIDGRAMVTRWLETRYHKPNDDMGQPLNFDAAAKMARVNLAVAYAIAQLDDRPRWNAGDFFASFGKAGKPATRER